MGQARGWLGWSAHSLGAALCKDQGQYPAFVPGRLKRKASESGQSEQLWVNRCNGMGTWKRKRSVVWKAGC